MIITKYTRIPIGQMLIWVDCAIVFVALAAFKDWQIPLYSILVIYITGRAVDMILEGANYNKALIIISDEHEKIRDKIVIDLERGGTYLKGVGMYTNAEKSVIFTVVSRREVAILEEQIAAIDPHAFITIMDASEILGEGFVHSNTKSKINILSGFFEKEQSNRFRTVRKQVLIDFTMKRCEYMDKHRFPQ